MGMTDPIADLLARIRNAYIARHKSVKVPASKVKLAIVEILKAEGYLEDFGAEPPGPGALIRIQLKYDVGGRPAISGMERISRPGRRVYRGQHDVPRVLGGLGIAIVSTPRGVMTGASCAKTGIGGEVLCHVW